MGPNSIAIFSIIAFATAAVADVTLYEVVGPTPVIYSDIDTMSAVGVDSGGSTTYVGTFIENIAVQPDGTTTRTLLSAPTTFGATFVEDKSGLHDLNGLISCTFMADGKGACVGNAVTVQAGGGPSGTDTVSLSVFTTTGSVVPWTTIKDPGPTAAPTTTVAAPTTTAAPTNEAGVLRFPSILTAICLSVMYLLL